MVLKAFVKRARAERNTPDVPPMVPVSVISDWVDANTAPETADNSGSAVTAPLALTRDDLVRIHNVGIGTSLQIRLKYDDELSSITDPVVQPFGFDGADKPQRLVNADGDHELTLTTAATDVTDGTFKYTDPVEVDMDGNSSVLVAIKTALNGTGTKNTATIQVRVK